MTTKGYCFLSVFTAAVLFPHRYPLLLALVRSISTSTIFFPITLATRHLVSAKQKLTQLKFSYKELKTHLHARFLSLSFTENTFRTCVAIRPNQEKI